MKQVGGICNAAKLLHVYAGIREFQRSLAHVFRRPASVYNMAASSGACTGDMEDAFDNPLYGEAPTPMRPPFTPTTNPVWSPQPEPSLAMLPALPPPPTDFLAPAPGAAGLPVTLHQPSKTMVPRMREIAVHIVPLVSR